MQIQGTGNFAKPQQSAPTNSYASAPSGGGYNLGFGGQNPFVQANVNNAQQDIVKNYQTAIAPQMASQNAASGSFGNSGMQQMQTEQQRQLGQNLGNVATSMYSNAYNTDQANQTTRQGQGMSYDLGLRNNDLGFAGLDSNINQNNFNNQLAGANFGLNTYNTLMNGNNLGLNAANSIQSTPRNYFNNFSNNANAIGNGYGTSTTGTTSNGMVSGLGVGQIAGQLYNGFNTGSSGYYSDPTQIPMQPGGGY